LFLPQLLFRTDHKQAIKKINILLCLWVFPSSTFPLVCCYMHFIFYWSLNRIWRTCSSGLDTWVSALLPWLNYYLRFGLIFLHSGPENLKPTPPFQFHSPTSLLTTWAASSLLVWAEMGQINSKKKKNRSLVFPNCK
jgi:hypothetical protein